MSEPDLCNRLTTSVNPTADLASTLLGAPESVEFGDDMLTYILTATNTDRLPGPTWS
jgi:hypothetical protein